MPELTPDGAAIIEPRDFHCDVGPCHLCQKGPDRIVTVTYPDGKTQTFPNMSKAIDDAASWQPDDGEEMPPPRAVEEPPAEESPVEVPESTALEIESPEPTTEGTE